MKKIKFFCIFIILVGSCLLAYSCFFLPPKSAVFSWLLGLASALIIIGLGYLINTILLLSEANRPSDHEIMQEGPYYITVKQRAGYLVCKIMNILLCIYLLILSKLQVEQIVLILCIVLILLQYLLDLFFLIILSKRKEE